MPPPPGNEVGEIHLLRLGDLPTGLLELLAARVSRRTSTGCRPKIESLRPPGGALIADRGQLDADLLLSALETDAPEGAALVGVTAYDIAVPVFTFVFGRARLGGRAALVSIARLDPVFYGLPPSRELLLARTEAEILHELGHVASLGHCRQPKCLMHFAGSVERADARGSLFCDDCQGFLPPWLRPKRGFETEL